MDMKHGFPGLDIMAGEPADGPEDALRQQTRKLLWAVGLVVPVLVAAATLVPIGGAVIGQGQLGMESSAKRVTHPNGGVTVFRDGSLNPASCWRMMTPWSLFSSTVGLARLFPNSDLFNREAIGGWRRDSVREVDIVVGCLMLVPTELWRRLGGFDERFFMYGEDADLCLRARALGYQPMITPDATIMHLVGASTKRHADKVCAVMQAKSTLIRRHWPRWLVPLGIAQLWLWGLARGLASALHPDAEQRSRLRQIWQHRKRWLAGFPELQAR